MEKDSSTKLSVLFADHHAEVLAYCVRRIGHADGEDAAAEVFAVASRRVDEIDWKTVRPWLFGVARGVLANRWRSLHRLHRINRRVAAMAATPADSPDEIVIRTVEARAALNALGKLRPLDREILMLSAWEELSAADIAIALGISVDAAKKRLERAKETFHQSAPPHGQPIRYPGRGLRGRCEPMRPVEQAYEQLRRANPVPDAAALLRELTEADTQRGRNPMNTITTDAKKPTPTGRPRGWAVGLTAAAVVLILGVATVFVTTGGNPFAGGPSPVEIAEAYIDARNDYDAERALELVSEDFTTNETPDGHVDASTLERAFLWHETQGFEFTDVTCEQIGQPPDGVPVTCDAAWSVNLHRVGNFPPGSTYRLILVI